LHDSAQQRLLALSFDLRLARAAAAQEGDQRVTAELDAAVAEAQVALEELRELAHGIYPAVLTEAGLAAALATLADEAPVAVELTVAAERFDADVEAARTTPLVQVSDRIGALGGSTGFGERTLHAELPCA
jgi:signal transduction histidine kinase